jgi:hypothetical protein
LILPNFPETAKLLVFGPFISEDDSQMTHRFTEKTEKIKGREKLEGITKLGKWAIGR